MRARIGCWLSVAFLVVGLPACESESAAGRDADGDRGLLLEDDPSPDLSSDTPGFPELNPPGFLDTCKNLVVPSGEVEILALIPDDWSEFCFLRRGPRPISEEFLLSAEVELDASRIPAPSPCFGDHGPCAGVAFELGDASPAFVVQSTEIAHETRATRIRVGPGRFRWRSSIRFTPPVADSVVALAELVPGCDFPCAVDATRCPYDGVCYASAPSDPGNWFAYAPDPYCVGCLGGSLDVCSCWRLGDWQPEGTRCDLFGACSDIVPSGECRAGRCFIE